MTRKEDPRFCPVKNDLCPQGIEKAKECWLRFEMDYDPIRNIRDFDIICCSYQKIIDGQNSSERL